MDRIQKIREQTAAKSNQSQVGTVLAAIDDTLRASGTAVNATSLFASLLVLLETNASYPAVYLLDAVADDVSPGLLSSKFNVILNAILPLLNSEEAATARSAIGVLTSLLKAQTLDSWRTTMIAQVFKSLLALGLDARPKVRKRAIDGICTILMHAPVGVAKDSPAAVIAAEELLKSAESQTRKGDRSAVHTLHIIKAVAGTVSWPVNYTEALCDLLLKGVSEIGEGFITIVAFEVFEKVFEQNDVDPARLKQLLATITAFKPNEKDANVLPSWLAVVARGHQNADASEIAPIYKSVFPFLQSDVSAVRKACSKCLQSLIAGLPGNKSTPASQAIATTTLRGLNSGSRYRAARVELFEITTVLFDKLQSKSIMLLECLPVLEEARAVDKEPAERALGAAIAAVGPETFFRVLPLNLELEGRAWLLPILRDNVTHTHISYFIQNLVPITEKFYPLSVGDSSEAKIFKTVIEQIWASLPGFCDHPTDIHSFTPEFAELLANVMYKEPDLRTTISNALQNLCRSNKDDAQSISVAKHMQSFAGNFLSVFFNVYAQSTHKENLLTTIKAFLSIARKDTIDASFQNVLKTFTDGLENPEVKHIAMDLMIAFVPYMTGDVLWEVAIAQMTSDDSTMQKKAYKIITGTAELHKVDLKAALLGKTVHQSVRKERLAALIIMVRQLADDDLAVIASILSEAVLCTKEQNEKARSLSFDLLVLMGQRMRAGGMIRGLLATEMIATIQEFFVMVQAGLGSDTPHMVSATVTALARLLFEFSNELNPAFISEMFDLMEPIMNTNNREVARSCLGFCKVVVTSPIEVRLESLVQHLLTWSHEHSRDFKSKVKHLLERMVRRFGYERLDQCVPETDKKLLINIRKSQKKKSAEAKEEVDQEAYIQATDEPMDLLDRSALTKVSSTNPKRKPDKEDDSDDYKIKDGRYVFGEESSESEAEPVISEMMEARQQRNARGGVKFSNKRERDEDFDEPTNPITSRPKEKYNKKVKTIKGGRSQKAGGRKTR